MSRATIDAFHGSEDTIGVRGPTGAIYRRFVSEGAPEFVGAVDELMKLNLVDELLESGKVAEGCIAIFRVK